MHAPRDGEGKHLELEVEVVAHAEVEGDDVAVEGEAGGAEGLVVNGADGNEVVA